MAYRGAGKARIVRNEAALDIKDLTARFDLVNEVARTVDLKQGTGNKWWGCCPIHGERTPSLVVYDLHQSWWCYGCHQGRDLVDWWVKAEGLSWKDALERLQREAGSRAKIERVTQQVEVPPIAEDVVSLYCEVLSHSHPTREWLKRERLWSDEIIRQCQIGMDPADRRITWPIRHPLTGEIVDIRRYRPGGSPKILPYSAGRGAMPLVIGSGKGVVLCEGEPDAFLVASLGLPAATNTCGAGSAARVWGQWEMLLGVPTVAICFDADEPGRSAAREVSRVFGDRALIISVPDEGCDITDYTKQHGATGTLALIQKGLSERRRRSHGHVAMV